MAIKGSIFGLNTVYAKQVQNTLDRTSENWPEFGDIPLAGYFVGENSPRGPYSNRGSYSRIIKLEFSTNTFSSPTNGSFSRGDNRSCQTPSYGYYSNGFTAPPPGTAIAYDANIEKLDFSTESTTDTGVDYPVAIYDSGICQNNLYAFNAGGVDGFAPGPFYANTTQVSNVRRFDLTSETVSTPGNNLPYEVEALKGTQSNTHGYMFGGFKGSPPKMVSSLLRFDFDSDTFSDPGNYFPPGLGKSYLNVTESQKGYAYMAGGWSIASPTGYTQRNSQVHRFDFSNDTISDLANLSTDSVWGAGTVSSNDFGYMVGGYMQPSSPPFDPSSPEALYLRIIDFDTETTTTDSTGYPATLSETEFPGTSKGYRHLLGEGTTSKSGGGAPKANYADVGYIAGGRKAPGSPQDTYSMSSIVRFDMTEETFSLPGFHMDYTARFPGGGRGLSSNYYGYMIGGEPGGGSKKSRLDFQSDTVLRIGDFPTNPGRSQYSTAQSSNTGYIVGGYDSYSGSKAFGSAINRQDFFNETDSLSSSQLPEKLVRSGSFTVNNYGYFGGGTGSPPSPNYRSSIHKIELATEVLSTLPGQLSISRTASGGVASRAYMYGYFGGGYAYVGSDTYYSAIDKVDFSNETASVLSGVNLENEKMNMSVLENPSYGYFTGGSGPPFPNYMSSGRKLSFDTETLSPIPNQPSGRISALGIKNSN